MPKLVINIPDEIAFVENDLRRFVDAMVHKLNKNRHKGKWADYTVEHAFGLLKGEMDELAAAIKAGNSMEATLEAADVANFAMILSNIGIDRGRTVYRSERIVVHTEPLVLPGAETLDMADCEEARDDEDRKQWWRWR